MNPNDTNDNQLDMIRIADELPDDAARQLTAYKNKMLMMLYSWRAGFATERADRDYQLEDGELLQLRSSSVAQLLAEHRLVDGARIRYDYDESRANDQLVLSAYEADGEVLTVTGTLAEQYDQLAGLLFSCTEAEKHRLVG